MSFFHYLDRSHVSNRVLSIYKWENPWAFDDLIVKNARIPGVYSKTGGWAPIPPSRTLPPFAYALNETSSALRALSVIYHTFERLGRQKTSVFMFVFASESTKSSCFWGLKPRTWESWERKARMLIDRFPFQLLMLCYRFGIVLGSMMKRYPREQYRENCCTPASILRPLLGACFEDMRHEKHMGFWGFPWKRLPSEIAFTLWKHGTFVKTTAYKTTKKRGFPWQGSSKLDFSQNYTISPETWVSSSRLDANPFFAT